MAHIHSVKDTDTRFLIEPITRAIKNNASKKTTLMQNDHNSERFTFEIPRYIEDHDMSQCNEVEVHYLNISAANKGNQRKGRYVVTDLQINPDDPEKVICSWLISQNATQLVGALSFRLRFKCIEDGVITYAWHTAIHTGVSVSDGINADETFEIDYVDIIEQWKHSVMAEFTDDIENGLKNAAHKFVTVIDSQERFDKALSEIPNGGTFKIVCDVHAVNDIVIHKPCTIYSDNNSKIIFDAGKFILKNTVNLQNLYISGLTYDYDNISGIINVHAPCIIQGCELDGKTAMTDGTNTGIGGYGIALFEGADGTVIDCNHIHNVSNSFIENWHNNVYLGHPQVNNLKITNNTLVDSETGDGIALNTNNSLVKGNSLNGKWENGFLVHPKNENGADCENVIFDGNVFNVTVYQDIKNGYGIAIRQADDKLSASNNCQVINNIFNGWGNTANGVEGIRVDSACKGTVVKGNVFPNGNTPSRGVGVRDWGQGTIISENKIIMSSGFAAIQKCGGFGKIMCNSVNTNGNVAPLVIADTDGQIDVAYNTICVDGNTTAQAIYVQVDNVQFHNNRITSNTGGIVTNTTAKGLVIAGNVFETIKTAIGIYCQNAKIINNKICGGFDGIAMYQQSANVFVFGNDIETTGDNGRDCVINYGTDNDIHHNTFVAAKRNALKITETASGRCVVANNIFFANSAIALENYLDLIHFVQNHFDTPSITYAGSGMVVFTNNIGVSATRINGIPLVFDGELMQSVVPGSGGENDIAEKRKEYIKEHKIIVVHTSTTPYQYYKAMSNGTWKNIF